MVQNRNENSTSMLKQGSQSTFWCGTLALEHANL